MEEKLPVVWLPQGEIGNSPSQPAALNDGPYAGQMIHGEVTHGGVKRVFVEEVDGQYQGAVFRFTQGLEAGINRLVWGPDGALYVGGVGSTGNWGQEGKKRYGLQRLKYNGTSVFEMLAVRAKTNGIEIEFTEPLAEGVGRERFDYHIQQWRYVPTAEYGGPKIAEETLEVNAALVSEDRRRVFLSLGGMKEGHVIYVHLYGLFESEAGRSLWSTEAWYTLNQIPTDDIVEVDFERKEPNTLTDAERAEGFRLLFDGETLDGWRGYGKDTVPSGWGVIDGTLTFSPGQGSGDLMPDEQFDNFELRLEWKVSEGGNSGVMYRVSEDHGAPYETGAEMQVLDNRRHPDGRNPKTSAGANYALHAPTRDVTRPAGTFNEARLIVNDGQVEHWLNGEKIVSYTLWDEAWEALVETSKFNEMPDYGRNRSGYIVLQDHGDKVWFRNIRIRAL
jgi:cytochrome c